MLGSETGPQGKRGSMHESGAHYRRPRNLRRPPCIRGLWIRVKDVLELLASGATPEEILAEYPYLEPDDIRAALEYATAQADHPVIRVA